jgi:hypothetical protein
MVAAIEKTTLSALKTAFAQISSLEVVGEAVRITTHCLYPSNGLVRVFVRLHGTRATVSDDRGALNEAQSAGINVTDFKDRSLSHIVKPYGLELRQGQVFASHVPVNDVAGVALLVANASKSVADWIYGHFRVKRNRDFKALLGDLLQRNFHTILHHNVEIPGINKTHHFVNVLSFSGGRRLLIDPVGNEPASYNSRIIANLDVKARNDPSIEQRIIYDDEEKWSAENLNLLNMGATIVPFSKSPEVFRRLVAAH